MRILEARDGFIRFESETKIVLSSFVLAQGVSKQYVAQVIQSKKCGENYVAYAKILFLYDGTLRGYDKTLPNNDATLREFTFEILGQSLKSENSIIAGNFIDENINISIDKVCFNKKMLISCDSAEHTNIIISNFAQQFATDSNVVVVDMLGIVNSSKYVAGDDFKLPLNTAALEFMYEDCLNDATSDSKNLIKEIFRDLAEYSKTVPFLPFGALKSIVDDMVDKSHIFKLLVLKNKLTKFDMLGYFATNVNEAENLNKILGAKSSVIDLSKLDITFQNRYLSVIYSTLAKLGKKAQVFVIASNALSKKNIKTILTSDLASTFVTHSRFKYINEIKSMFDNFIIEPSFANNNVFKIYSAFLNAMPKDTYLLVGEGTNYIPLVSTIESINTLSEEPILTDSQETDEFSDEDLTAALDLTEEAQITSSEEELDPQSKAIEEKAENLIEKVADEVSSTTVPDALAMFEDEQEDEEGNLEELINEENSEDRMDETIEEDVVTDLEDVEEYHTVVDNTEASEIEEIKQVEENQEVSDNEYSIAESEQEIFGQIEETEEIVEIPSEISEFSESIPDFEPEEEEKEIQEYTKEIPQEPNVIPAEEETDITEEIEEVVELDETEIPDDAILVELEDSENSDDILEQEIMSDVDKVFTTIKDDSITDSDLDFIDELNNNDDEVSIDEFTETEFNSESKLEALVEDDELNELVEGMEQIEEISEDEDDEYLEPLEEFSDSNSSNDDSREILQTRNTATPMVPVYNADIPAEDLVSSDAIEQGDTVVHAKYGTGMVEKMIKYGTKTLYSINFDNIGRRLLDPTLTEIKKA